MTSRRLKPLAILLLLAVAAFWYWSPFLTLHQMRSAAKAGDAEAFNAYVDYPKLRDNMKQQLLVSMGASPEAEQADGKSPSAGARFGRMLGAAMVGGAVDALVRPEVVMRAMQQGKLMPKAAPKSEPDSAPREDAPAEYRLAWSTEHEGVNRFVFHARSANASSDRDVSLVLERQGFATWRLTEIRIQRL